MHRWYAIYVVFVQILSLYAHEVVSSNSGYRSIACSNADHNSFASQCCTSMLPFTNRVERASTSSEWTPHT